MRLRSASAMPILVVTSSRGCKKRQIMALRVLSVLAIGMAAAHANAQTPAVGPLFSPPSSPVSRLASEGLGYSVVYPPTGVEPRSFRVLLVCFGAEGPKTAYCPTRSHYGSCVPPVGTLV